jgi:hypothetical protein
VKRQFAVHHDGATPDGRFCTAIHAFPPINRAQPTQSLRRALSAHKPVLLSHFFHVVNACRFIWKLFKEVFCCHNHHIFSKPQAPLRNLFMFYIQTDIHCLIIKEKITTANKKYNAYRNFIFIENDSVNLKIRNTLKLIEQDAARIIFKTLWLI